MNFDTNLNNAIAKVSRAILFGRYEALVQLPGAVNLGQGVKTGTTKGPHPEVETSFRSGTNPDLLTCVDQDSKMRGFGTNNCITCKYFIANKQCPKNTKAILNQSTVKALSNGGCSLHDMIDELNDGQGYPNQLMDEIITIVDGDSAVLYKGGTIRELDLVQDLGIKNPTLMHDQEEAWRNGDDHRS